ESLSLQLSARSNPPQRMAMKRPLHFWLPYCMMKQKNLFGIWLQMGCNKPPHRATQSPLRLLNQCPPANSRLLRISKSLYRNVPPKLRAFEMNFFHGLICGSLGGF